MLTMHCFESLEVIGKLIRCSIYNRAGPRLAKWRSRQVWRLRESRDDENATFRLCRLLFGKIALVHPEILWDSDLSSENNSAIGFFRASHYAPGFVMANVNEEIATRMWKQGRRPNRKRSKALEVSS